MAGRLRSVMFRGPVGSLEGLWKEASDATPRRGTAVFAHPHPLHGGTMHNKVVYRAAQALTRSGYDTLRFNFRGVGLSEGRYDAAAERWRISARPSTKPSGPRGFRSSREVSRSDRRWD